MNPVPPVLQRRADPPQVRGRLLLLLPALISAAPPPPHTHTLLPPARTGERADDLPRQIRHSAVYL